MKRGDTRVKQRRLYTHLLAWIIPSIRDVTVFITSYKRKMTFTLRLLYDSLQDWSSAASLRYKNHVEISVLCVTKRPTTISCWHKMRGLNKVNNGSVQDLERNFSDTYLEMSVRVCYKYSLQGKQKSVLIY